MSKEKSRRKPAGPRDRERGHGSERPPARGLDGGEGRRPRREYAPRQNTGRNAGPFANRSREDAIRDVVLEIWRAVHEGWKRSDDVIARAFRHHPRLTDGQRDQIVTTLHGMIVNHRKIERALDSLHLPPATERHRETLAYTAYLILARWLKPDAPAAKAQEVAWFDEAAIDALIAAEPDPVQRMGIQRGLPDFLAARLIAIHGEKADALADALGKRAPQTLRANTLKTTRDNLIATLKKENIEAASAVYSPTAVTLARRLNAFRRPEFQAGLFEVQDESSQLAAEVVAPPPGSLVIDFCAGAGGKTLAVGALMKNKGRLFALETQAYKLTELRKRIARSGLSNAQALAIGETTWPAEVEALKGKAARVLVDVPCSGTGALRRNPEARWRLAPEDLTRLPALQESIARRAMDLVAPGGRLVYATCSIMPEENEAVVEKLVAESNGAWEPVLIKEILGGKRAEPICDPAGKYLKLLPSVHGCDGFFTAVLRKKATGPVLDTKAPSHEDTKDSTETPA